jgi:proline iminopeptidase
MIILHTVRNFTYAIMFYLCCFWAATTTTTMLRTTARVESFPIRFAVSHSFLKQRTLLRLLPQRTPCTTSRTTTNCRFRASADESLYDISKLPSRKGSIPVTRQQQQYNIAYTILRPMALSSRQAAPVVVLHGGPSLPSDYLLPLGKVVPYRSMVFYDQLGCGESDEPPAAGDMSSSTYSISQSVDDLEAVIAKLSLRRFHLYGHSYGGILAYEYIKRRVVAMWKKATERTDPQSHPDDSEVLSVVLSSAPTNIAETGADWDRLAAGHPGEATRFWRTHQCRTEAIPPPLEVAYRKAGTVWAGTGVISDYVATPPPPRHLLLPSCLYLRGEYDFVMDAGWKDIWSASSSRFREKVLVGCSHHASLEDPVLYGEILESFFAEYD